MTFLRILTLAVTALVVVPGGAHLFELPGKIGLGQEAYFTVQRIYAGWALFAVPIFAAIGLNLALSWAERRRAPGAARWALGSAALIALSLGVFFVRVFPANQATANWTTQPEGWEALRTAWEYGHAVNAAVVFVAFVATCLAVVRRSVPATG